MKQENHYKSFNVVPQWRYLRVSTFGNKKVVNRPDGATPLCRELYELWRETALMIYEVVSKPEDPYGDPEQSEDGEGDKDGIGAPELQDILYSIAYLIRASELQQSLSNRYSCSISISTSISSLYGRLIKCTNLDKQYMDVLFKQLDLIHELFLKWVEAFKTLDDSVLDVLGNWGIVIQ
jgi:hypothetical protein